MAASETRRRRARAAIALALALLVCAFAAAAQAGRWPAPVQQLADKGVTIVRRFAAPGGLTGFVARAGHRPVTLFLTPDGQHVIVGTLFDASGQDLSQPQLDKLATNPAGSSRWTRLASATWLTDGKADAPRTVYVFVDPNCPYCRRFYTAARPWVKAGRVRFRVLPVGVLAPTSTAKAAAILAASHPTRAYRQQERDPKHGVKPMHPVPAGLKAEITANDALMDRLGIRGTPGIVYRDADGDVHIHQGVPDAHALRAILGPKP